MESFGTGLENTWDDDDLESHVSLGAWVIGWVEENHCAMSGPLIMDLLFCNLVAGCVVGGCDDGGCDEVFPWLVADVFHLCAYNQCKFSKCM